MPIAMTDKNNNRYYLHYDQVGSLRAVTDTNGNIIKEITYDSYGNIISDTNPNFKVPFGFAGGLYDPDTKLVHFGYREYDPETGRWLSKDPLLFGGGDSNLYGYVLQDPVNLVDPSGEFWQVVAIAALGAYTVYAIVDAFKTFFKKNKERQKAVIKCYIDPLNEKNWEEYEKINYQTYRAGGSAALSVPGTSVSGPPPTSAYEVGVGGVSTAITNSAGLGK